VICIEPVVLVAVNPVPTHEVVLFVTQFSVTGVPAVTEV
jgi:hypothetical protein